jgi:hypothetical protein
MRALKRKGREEFRDWLLRIEEHPDCSAPIDLLLDEATSFGIPGSSDVVATFFSTKFELAKTILPHVEEVESLGVNHDCWPGIWDGLALLFFESICPRNADGLWNPNRREHYIYDPGFQVRHRHRIYGPVTLFRAGRESLKPFFQGKPCIHGDFEEQIGALQEFAGNPVALQVLRALYAINGAEQHIPGYGNRRKFKGFKKLLPVPGSLRRFTTVSQQLKRTYDLAGITFDGYLDLLPSEFSEWLNT